MSQQFASPEDSASAPSPVVRIGATRRVLGNSAWNLAGLVLSTIVSLLLPPFIVHRLPQPEYAAWVLILQLSAYVNFLEFGVQTAVGKFVAEHDARGDKQKCERVVASAFLMLSVAASLGLVLIAVLVYRVPQLFHQMPAILQPQVRAGLAAVGVSVCLMLPMSVFFAIFFGLQRYRFPTLILGISKLLLTAALVSVLLLHGSLVQMAAVSAVSNVLTAVAVAVGWYFLARDRIGFAPRAFDGSTLRELLQYCGVLGIWSAGMLLISGLDTTIVGHYDYAETGFYAVAASATNFMLLIVGSLMAPLMPAASSAGTTRSAEEMGSIAVRINRYGVLFVLSIGLPLLVCGFPALRLWMGNTYAIRSLSYLRILALANIIRYLTYPYIVMVVAGGRQRAATLSPVCESLLNIALSLLLAKRYGAAGVAVGTLMAAVVGVSLHVIVSMRRTNGLLTFARMHMLVQGILRPLAAVIPTALMFTQWRGARILPMTPAWLALWILSTVALVWFVALNTEDRRRLLQHPRLRLRFT